MFYMRGHLPPYYLPLDAPLTRRFLLEYVLFKEDTNFLNFIHFISNTPLFVMI